MFNLIQFGHDVIYSLERILWVKTAQEHFDLIFYYKTDEKSIIKIIKLKDFLASSFKLHLNCTNVFIKCDDLPTFKSCVDHISP